MRPIVHAGFYLLARSLKNRARRLASRLRQPRYVLALLVGIGYFTLVLWGQRAQNGPPLAIPVMQVTGTLLLAILATKWWLFGADRLALAFSPAEIQFLFPAPVSRAGLLGYKLLRAQLLIMVNVVLWLLLLNRGWSRALPLPVHGLTIWLMFTTLFLHRLGVALTRDSLTEHGRAGLRRHWPAVAGLAGLVLVVVFTVQHFELPPDGPPLSELSAFLETPPLAWVLYPFRLPLLPLSAPSLAAWFPLFLVALGVGALHLWWVIRADRAFEEASIEASARRAELLDRWRTQGIRGRAPARRAWRWGRLAPQGHPVGAIIWKNLTRLLRTASPGIAGIIGLLLAGIVGFAVLEGDEHLEIMVMIGTMAFGWMAVLIVFGPQWVRNDLRGELDHIQQLRTWPLSGRALMAGQVASSTVVLTATQALLSVVGLVAVSQTRQQTIPLLTIAGLYVPALLALSGLNLVALSIQNAGALLFPSWVRTEIRPAGIEAMGQHLLTAGISLLLLLLGAAGPLALGGAAAWLGWESLGWWSLLPGLLLATVGFALEGFLLLDWMGDRFEALDVTPAE